MNKSELEQLKELIETESWPEIPNLLRKAIAELEANAVDEGEVFYDGQVVNVTGPNEVILRVFAEGGQCYSDGYPKSNRKYAWRNIQPLPTQLRRWEGGDCPLPAKTPCIIWLRDGDIYATNQPEQFRWSHDQSYGDIIGFNEVEHPKWLERDI